MPVPNMPHGSVSLPMNDDCKHMGTQHQMKEVEISTVFCEVCEARTTEATSRCQECDNYLCAVCKSAHLSFKVLRHHTIVALRVKTDRSRDGIVGETAPPDTPTPTASSQGDRSYNEHSSKVPQFFCKTCQMVICRVDIIIDHPNPDHKCVHWKDVIGHKRAELLETIKTSRQSESQLDAALNQLSDLDRQIESATHTAQTQVNRAADHALVVSQKRVEEQRKHSLQEVITFGMQRRQIVISQRDALQSALASLRQTRTLAAGIVENSSDREMLTSCHALTESLLQQMNSLGSSSCELENGSYLDKFAFSPEKYDPIEGLHRVFAIGTLGHVTGEWFLHREIGGEMSSASCLAASRWGEVIVADNQRRTAQIFDHTGEYKLSLTTVDSIVKEKRVGVDKILGIVRAVAFSKAGHIIICDCSNFVKVFSGQGRYLCAFKTTATGDNCCSPVLLCCLAVDDLNRVYVGDRNRRCVTIHEPTGSRVRLIECTRPAQLTVAGRYLVVLPADPTDSIKLLDYMGNTQRALVIPESLGPWLPVSLVCSAEHKKIFVVNGHKDGDRAVHEFSMEGDYRGCVAGNMTQPAGIAVARSQNSEELFVADDKSIKVFRRL